MNLLEQEIQKKQEPKGKKIVLTLLIISIILLVISVIAIYLLKSNKSETLSLNANDKEIIIQENMLVTGENGKTYMSIGTLANIVGYDYIKGGYLEHKENKDKCYIENINLVIEYEANSNVIRKIVPESNVEDEYYNLKNKVITNNNNMFYIALEDLNVGCNIVYEFVEEENKIVINSTEYLVEKYNEDKNFEENKLLVDEGFDNQRAMIYNMIVVKNSEQKMGVIDNKGNSLIGYKYSTIKFNECSQNFIVSSDNKYGVISKDGKLIVELKYDDISIMSYYPLLYKVKINNKYGIVDEDGQIVIGIEYDKIGFNEKSNIAEPVNIIKDIQNDDDGIVVCKDNKYGIANLKTGKMIINCEVDKIYSKNSDLEDKYYIELQGIEIELNTYIEYVNTTIITY